ncbi:hypothetical protein GQ600_3353 [Phytophthora cactorum]|nr:hypothetical protein GQ600_3353 [Phytophthora cactorum]
MLQSLSPPPGSRLVSCGASRCQLETQPKQPHRTAWRGQHGHGTSEAVGFAGFPRVRVRRGWTQLHHPRDSREGEGAGRFGEVFEYCRLGH